MEWRIEPYRQDPEHFDIVYREPDGAVVIVAAYLTKHRAMEILQYKKDAERAVQLERRLRFLHQSLWPPGEKPLTFEDWMRDIDLHIAQGEVDDDAANM